MKRLKWSTEEALLSVKWRWLISVEKDSDDIGSYMTYHSSDSISPWSVRIKGRKLVVVVIVSVILVTGVFQCCYILCLLLFNIPVYHTSRDKTNALTENSERENDGQNCMTLSCSSWNWMTWNCRTVDAWLLIGHLICTLCRSVTYSWQAAAAE